MTERLKFRNYDTDPGSMVSANKKKWIFTFRARTDPDKGGPSVASSLGAFGSLITGDVLHIRILHSATNCPHQERRKQDECPNTTLVHPCHVVILKRIELYVARTPEE